jgi:hypothetical protein
MPRFCHHPEHTFVELESDADISLHILEHQVATELQMGVIMADLTALKAAADAIVAKLAASETDQAGVDAITAELNDAANPPAPAAPVDSSPVVDPTTGLLPDGTIPSV